MEEAIKKSEVLIEALPYIRKFRDKLFVIKYGGSILFEEKVRRSVLQDVVFLYFMGIDVLLVHGGGPNITERLKELNLKSEFYEGMRITDFKTLQIVEEELLRLNSLLTEEIGSQGARAKGVNGKEGFVYSRKKRAKKDLGFVGEVSGINIEALNSLIKDNHIVILAPMAKGQDGLTYNINADEVASFVAGTFKAEKLVLLTNIKGVMRDVEDEDSLISSISEREIKILIKERVISEGMIPKVKAALDSLEKGVKKVHIIDARIPHALLLEIFTDKGIGTEIIK